MNYLKVKIDLIEKARLRERTNPIQIYKEKHHIIPRSLGGSDEKENLVELTFREHLLIHKIEYKIAKNKNDKIKMGLAICRMIFCKNENRYITSREYEYAKKLHSDIARSQNKKNSEKTRKQSLKISNKTIYEWWHDDFGYFKGTSCELTIKFPDQDLITSELTSVGRETNRKRHKGWRLFKYKDNIKEAIRQSVGGIQIDKTVYKFYHPNLGEFEGCCYHLAETFYPNKRKSSNFLKLAQNQIKHLEGWVLFENKNDYDKIISYKSGNSKFVTNGIKNTRIPDDKMEDFLKNNPDWYRGKVRVN